MQISQLKRILIEKKNDIIGALNAVHIIQQVKNKTWIIEKHLH